MTLVIGWAGLKVDGSRLLRVRSRPPVVRVHQPFNNINYEFDINVIRLVWNIDLIELMNSSQLMIISKFYHKIFGMSGQTIILKIVDGTYLDPARPAVAMNCRKRSFSPEMTDEYEKAL